MKNIIIGLLLLSSFFGMSQTKTYEQVIDSVYLSKMKKKNIMGMSIAIVDSGKIVYSKGYGYAVASEGIKVDENTAFRIGSCTKSFTALSLLQLQDNELLNINSSIKNYVPEFTMHDRFGGNRFLIKDILTHTAGLPSDILHGFFSNNPKPLSWTVQELNKHETISPPGFKTAYSNAGYALLGRTIEKVSGISYAQYVDENIFSPLNMMNSSITETGEGKTVYSLGYDGKKEHQEPQIRDISAGAIWSSAADMGSYILMYLNQGNVNGKQIISSEAIVEMSKNHVENIVLYNDDKWGYGLTPQEVVAIKDGDTTSATYVSHGGDTYLYHADFCFIPELQVGAVILTNSKNGSHARNAMDLVKLYMDKGKGWEFKMKNELNEFKNYNFKNKNETTDININGTYNAGPLVMTVNNSKKIKFKQSIANIALVRKHDSLPFTLRFGFLGVRPFKLKGQTMTFSMVDGKKYLKIVNTGTKWEEFIGKETEVKPIPESWQAMFGSYEVAGKLDHTPNFKMGSLEGTRAELLEKDGFLFLNMKGKTFFTKQQAFMEVLSDTVCIGGGVGRNSGNTLTKLSEDSFYYQGLMFKKK